jgi:hypothetical protein
VSRGRHAKRLDFASMLIRAGQEAEKQAPGVSTVSPVLVALGRMCEAQPNGTGHDWLEITRAAFDGYDVHPATDEMHVREIKREAG